MAKRKALFVYTITDGEHPSDLYIVYYHNAAEHKQCLVDLGELDECQERRGFLIDPNAAEALEKAYDKLHLALIATVPACTTTKFVAAWIDMMELFRVEQLSEEERAAKFDEIKELVDEFEIKDIVDAAEYIKDNGGIRLGPIGKLLYAVIKTSGLQL